MRSRYRQTSSTVSMHDGLQVVEEGLQGYEVPGPDLDALHQQLEAFGRARVESAAREAAHTALPRMKDRFTEVRLRHSATSGSLNRELYKECNFASA